MSGAIATAVLEIRTNVAALFPDLDQLKKRFVAAGQAAAAMGKDLQKAGADAQRVGRTMSLAITAPLVAIGGTATKLALDFESSFAGVRKTVNATEAEFQQMGQAFRNLAKDIPVNVNELNRLGESAGALGIPKAAIVDFARVMAELGLTTNVTSDQAAESIAKIQNIFGAAGKDTERFASTLVALGNDGASTESQILEMATRIAGAGNAVGLTQGQVLAFASALSSVGIEAEMGGSAISKVFIDIATAVNQGGSAVKGFAAVAGQSVADFSRLFKTDAAAATNAFIEGLARVKREGGDLIGTVEKLGFTEVRVRDTLLRAAGAGDLLTKALKLQGDAWRENTALTAEAQKRFETVESKLTVLWNRIKDVGITVGNALLPGITALISLAETLLPYLDAMAQAFATLPGWVQAFAVAAVALVAAIGPALIIFGSIVSAVGTIAAAFAEGGVATTLLASVFGSAGTAAALLAGALEVLTGPVGWFVGISAAILTATGTWGDFFRILKAGAEILETDIARYIDNFVLRARVLWEAIKVGAGFIDDIFGISSSFKAMGEAFAWLMGGTANQLERFSRWLKGVPTDADAARQALERLNAANVTPMASHGGTPRSGPSAAAHPVSPMVDASFGAQLTAARAEISKLSSAMRQDLVVAVKSGAFELKALQERSGLSELAMKLFKEQLTDSAKGADALAKRLAGATSSMGDLSGAQIEAIRHYEAEGDSVAEIATKLEVYEHQVRQVIDAEKARLAAAKELTEFQKKVRAQQDDMLKALGQGTLRNLEASTSAMDKLRSGSQDEFQQQLAAVDRWVVEEKGKLDHRTRNWQEADAAIEAAAAAERDDIERRRQIANQKDASTFIGPQIPPEQAEKDARSFTARFNEIVSKDIPAILMRAFEGGGGVRGAVRSLAAKIGGDLLGTDTVKGWTSSLSSKLSGFLNVGKGLAGSAISSVVSGGMSMAINVGMQLLSKGLEKLMSIGGPSKMEREGRKVTDAFKEGFASTEDMIERVGAAYRANGKTSEEAQAALQRMWAAEKLGAEAARLAIAAITEELKRQQEVTDAIHSLGFQSQDEIRHAADIANAAYQQMLATAGQYTEAQIAEQYRHYQELLAQLEGAAGEAARAWLEAHKSADDAAKASTDAMKSAEADLKASLDKRAALMKGLDAEAKEEHEGVVEQQQKKELAALDQQIQEKADAYAQLAQETGQKMADAIIEALRNMHIDPVHVPVVVDGPQTSGPRLNNDGSVDHDGDPVTPMARGGFGRVNGPRLFLAGEKPGGEDVVFGGAGRNLAADVATELSRIFGTDRPAQSQTLHSHITVEMDSRPVASAVVEQIVYDKRGVGTLLRKVLAPA